MPVSQIHRGMKGYGLTVFEGTRPERFDVEVIDVLKNFRPRQDLILIKTKHPRLEVAKVVAGMSGSPIYLDNKMIGAYAYGWSFGSEPVAGVTPIGLRHDPAQTQRLRSEGLVALPEDLGVDRRLATRSLLAAKSMADLVEWSGGLYDPPAKFRSW